ncbi:hypothetical protein HELRODRAFT_178494 [Helobdella robusta]|uniref:Uncharacterized protein n=1 Tax=Helobdella robusta TaxID=6412 RepID=T1FD94_HELRO|nr:hypothetical protein HELRODRAFT_178494 [Helobdella robusta]ESN97048.1 hypothetical protein HELRODRAFT_178494 [Helobdella robusta]
MEDEKKSDFVQMLNNQAKKALISFENCKWHDDIFPPKNALKRVCEELVLNLVLSDVDTEDSNSYNADLLFNYLDFATCKDDEKAWFLFTDLLVKNLINDKSELMYKNFVNTTQICWLGFKFI